MKTEQEEFQETSLFDVKKQMAMPRMAQSARHTILLSDTAETLMYIRRGFVKLAATSKTYKEAIVDIQGPGEFLGEGCLGSQNIRMRTATALIPTALQVIKRNEMIRALHHALAYRFLSYLISRNIEIEKDFVAVNCFG